MKILLMLLLLTSFSCKKKEENSNLVIEMTGKTIGLPFSIQSCADIAAAATTKSVAKVSAKFPQVTFKWSGIETLEIQYMELILTSGSLTNGKQTIPIDDIENLFGVAPTLTGTQTSSSPTSLQTGCELRIGGIKVIDESSPAYMTGTLRVLAQATSANGDLNAVTAEKDIEIEYQGIGSR